MFRAFLAFQIFLVSLAVVVIIAAGYGGYMAIGVLRTSVRLDQAQSGVVNEITGLAKLADRQLLNGWRTVAEDYLTERQLGQIDVHVKSIPAEWTERSLASYIAITVREAVCLRLEKKGRTFRYEDAIAEMKEDPRICDLFALEDARLQMDYHGQTAMKASNIEDVQKVSKEMEKDKHVLIRLMKMDIDKSREEIRGQDLKPPKVYLPEKAEKTLRIGKVQSRAV